VPVRLIWSPLARARLKEIHAFVSLDKPEAAERLVQRIVAVVEALKIHPHLGTIGSDPEMRELVIGGTPYIVTYSTDPVEIIIRSIWHGAQRRR
jgi:toxin ParE1/3/4